MKSIFQNKSFSSQVKLSNEFITFLIWIISGTTAYLVSYLWVKGAYIDGSYLPMGHDSFYHASRILDAVKNLQNYYQFDPDIHAPEGSWITWPWLYNLALAVVVSIVQSITGYKAIDILVFIPTIWVFVNSYLIIALATQLGLPHSFRLLAGLCFALSPLTLALHGVGMIDHHFMEQTFTFASLLLGIKWFKTPNKKNSLLFGTILGVSLGIHNSLFILQFPIVAVLFICWVRGIQIPNHPVKTLCFSFLLSLLLILLPSQPFQHGFFEYYTLSWFHLYVALITVGCIAGFQITQYSHRNAVIGVIILAVASLPLLNQVVIGISFITSEMYSLSRMTETISLLDMLRSPAWSLTRISRFYTLLIWILPIVIFFCIKELFFSNNKKPSHTYFWIFSLFAIAMMSQQYRFHYFGSFTLYLAPLMLFNNYFPVLKRTYIKPITISALMLLLYLPSFPLLTSVPPLALNENHSIMRPLYLSLGKQCEQDPGTVLADMTDGHYISYYTNCSVIANNFIQTRQHIEKIKLVESLLQQPIERLTTENRWIKYLLVRLYPTDLRGELMSRESLRYKLLSGTYADTDKLQLITATKQTRQVQGQTLSVAKLFRIRP